MKIRGLEWEVNVVSKRAKKSMEELKKAFDDVSISMERLQDRIKHFPKLEIEYSIVEIKKKKWYQFWKK